MSTLGRVVITDHDNTTLFVYEEVPDISYTFVRSATGSASWMIPFSHINLHRVSQEPPFAPKRTDYRIGVSFDNGVNWQSVHAGFCGPVELDSDISGVKGTGVDWTAWLDQPYRFPAYESMSNSEAEDIFRLWEDESQQTIIEDMIDNLDEVAINPDFEGSGWGTLLVASVILGDSNSVLDLIKNIGAYNNPYGFEFWMDWNKVLTFAAPRRVPIGTESTASIHSFAPSRDNVVKMNWVNAGPVASTFVGEQLGYRHLSDAPTVAARFRDWWKFVAFSDFKAKDLDDLLASIERKTEYIANVQRNPQRNLTLTMMPDKIVNHDPNFFRNRIGEVVHVDSENWFIAYHRVNNYFWIVQQTLRSDDVGNWTCELILEEVWQP